MRQRVFIIVVIATVSILTVLPHRQVGLKTSARLPVKRCLLEDFLNGSWNPSTHIQPQGYQYCQIDHRQDCRSNDPSYLGQSWEPHRKDCVPRPIRRNEFLSHFRNKDIVFVGDSMARNQQQSVQCMLMNSHETKLEWTDGFKLEYNSYFPEYNTSVQHLLSGWRDFLSPEHIHELNNFDIVIISVGSAWKRADSGLPSLEGKTVKEAKAIVHEAIRKRFSALEDLPKHIQIIWKTPDLPHWAVSISDNPWNLPCAAHKHSDPLQLWIREALLLENKQRPNAHNIHVMDVFDLIKTRADAHPNNHSLKFGGKHDCLHWCLPGIPDTINEIIFDFLQRM